MEPSPVPSVPRRRPLVPVIAAAVLVAALTAILLVTRPWEAAPAFAAGLPDPCQVPGPAGIRAMDGDHSGTPEAIEPRDGAAESVQCRWSFNWTLPDGARRAGYSLTISRYTDADAAAESFERREDALGTAPSDVAELGDEAAVSGLDALADLAVRKGNVVLVVMWNGSPPPGTELTAGAREVAVGALDAMTWS